MQEALVQFPTPHKLAMLVHACNPSTWVVEAGGSEVQGYLQFEAKTKEGTNKASL